MASRSAFVRFSDRSAPAAQKRIGQEDPALLLCKQGKAKDAEQTVRYALNLEQSRPIGKVVLGTVLLFEHRAEEAEKVVRDALALDSSTVDAYLVLAGVHGEEGDYAAEVQDLNTFLGLEPQSARSAQVRSIREVAESMAIRISAKRMPLFNNVP
jgi:predicted Zn-dependent protease